MLTLLILACKSDQGLKNNIQDPGRSLDQEACECPDNSVEITALQQELNTLRDRVVTLESAPTPEPEPEPEPVPAVVTSSYQVDCNRQTFTAAFNAEYLALRGAGSLAGYEGIWSHCPLVVGVEPGKMPHVTVAQVRALEVDTTCDASSCPSTSADGWWYNSNSGGHIVAGGWDDMRMAPGMQLRYDGARGVIYTSSDYRYTWSGRGEGPLVYEVTVMGDREFTAPEGW
jgi:hypothetical protein